MDKIVMAKRAASEKAAQYVRDGMVVGLGTGSTAYWAIQKLGEMTKNGLQIKAVATSNQSEALAKELQIPLIAFTDIDGIDVTIDGADEVDDEWNLIKGGGGALLREKIIASASKELIVVADEGKKVEQLGKFHLPVEIVQFGYELTLRKLASYGCIPHLRMSGEKRFITDNGNFIVDCEFGRIEQPSELHVALNMIPGVVENGLFIHLATKVIVGFGDGSVRELGR
ncbi:ribose-5-phosphate isomerase [Paenibacillus taihuensis]|uniref:Ribose-5-phosphate isomerase A n=1 Tax=Paenibacillus taihuensis TaxID=1156355 RepID=A0A3D9SFU6_9BACL|nr:ribose-5-phosphate isomerase RpiA [Paenibacillus taihuensis]REE89033.1 ribose-5-phosphate isomerase [Paenibacillus taihuensis]